MKFSVKWSMIILFLVITFGLFGCQANAADTANTKPDPNKIKQTIFKDTLVNQNKGLDDLLQFCSKLSGQGLALKIAILTDGQVRNNNDITTAAVKVFDKSPFAKFFVGPDYLTLEDMQKVLAYSSSRVEQLKAVGAEVKKTQTPELSGQYDQIISSIEKQTQQLDSITTKEQRSFSLFGWMIKLLRK